MVVNNSSKDKVNKTDSNLENWLAKQNLAIIKYEVCILPNLHKGEKGRTKPH